METAIMKSDSETLLDGLVQRKAFTLVELLVVISIIALLLSIMMPALQKARELSRRVTCTARLHQQGIALSAYGTTYNKFPPAVIPNGWPFGRMGYPQKGGNVMSNTPPWLPAGQAVLLREKFLTDARNLYCPSVHRHHITYNYFLSIQTNPAVNPKWPNELDYFDLWIAYPYWVTWTPRGGAGTSSDYPGETIDVVQLKITSQGPTSRGDTVAISDLTVTEMETADAGMENKSSTYWVNHAKDARIGRTALGGNTLYNDGSVRWLPFNEMKNNTKKHVTRDRDYLFYFWF
jgi:prepilin-type N-terminal cleavage/methylation domain-containing protein